MLEYLQNQPDSKKKNIILAVVVVSGLLLFSSWIKRASDFKPQSFFQSQKAAELKNEISSFNLNDSDTIQDNQNSLFHENISQ